MRNVVRLGGSPQEAKARTREEVINSPVKFELIQIVDVQYRRGTIITTNDLLEIYTSLLAALGCQDECDLKVQKRPLRQLVTDEIQDIEFSQALRRNEPDRLIRRHQYLEVVRSAVEIAMYEEEDEDEEIADNVEVESLWNAASILRKEALEFISKQANNFDGSASIDESGVPPKLLMFLRWFLAGKGYLHGKRNDNVDRSSITIGNQLLYSVKTPRQVAYTPVNAEKTHFKNKFANKQATILGLAVRQHGRQKAVVDMLHKLDLTISNKQCVNWETALGNAILDNASAHGGYSVPPDAQKSILASFHIDNAVFKTDALDGKSTVDTLMMSGFQRKAFNFPIQSLNVDKSCTSQTLKKNPYSEEEFCNAPKLTNFQLPERSAGQLFSSVLEKENLVRGRSMPWLLSQSLLGSEETEDLWTSVNTKMNIDLEETLRNSQKRCKIFV